jgi:hypothetical protein
LKKKLRRQKLFPNKEFSSSLIDFNDFDVAALEGLFLAAVILIF